MKQNKILNTMATTAIALILAVLSVQAAGAVTIANVDFPSDIAIDSAGNVYVANTGNISQEFTPTLANNNILIFKAGILTPPAIGDGVIEYPSGVAVDSAGNVYVADDTNKSVLKFSSTGALLKTISGVFNFPTAVAVNSTGYIFVTDTNVNLTDNHVLVFNPGGVAVRTIGAGALNLPGGVALDSANNIYVADSGHNHIQKFDPAGTLLQTIGTGILNFPSGIALDSNGNIYAADTGNDRVVVFNPDGSVKQAIGSRGAADGQFNLPMGVAVDSAGTNIYVADADNNRIQVIATASIPPPAVGNITGFSTGNGIRGSWITAKVNVTNSGVVSQTYVIVVSGVSSQGYPLAGSATVTLAAGQSLDNVPVLVSIPPVTPAGSYSLLSAIYRIETYPNGLITAAGPVTAAVS